MTPARIDACLILILMFSLAIHASFGVFQIPVAAEFGWPRTEFSMAIAIQNLAWGIGQPMFFTSGERYGDRKTIIIGALRYAFGLVLSSCAITPGQHQALAVLDGFGIAGTGFGVILPLIGRAASPEKRSLTLGIGSAIGSAGLVIGPPSAEALLQSYSWQMVFLIFSAALLLALIALPFLRAPLNATARTTPDEPMLTVVVRAFRDPSYALISLGFFSCGYRLGFITAHFPAFITEACGPIDPRGMLAGVGITTTSAPGAAAIAVIGIANIGGSVLSGWLGGKFHDLNLDYALVWWIGVSVGAFSAIIHLPIRERRVVALAA